MEALFLTLIFIIIFFFLAKIYKESFLIFFAIVTLLATPAEAVTFLRPVIQLLDFAILFYIFIKNYGIDFKNYPKVPGSVIILISFLFITLLLSVMFSNFPARGILPLLRTAAFFILVYLFYGIIRTKEHVILVLQSFFFAAMILMGSVVLDFFVQGRGFMYLIMPIRERNYGLYSNFNVTGSYAIVLFPLIILALIANRYNKKKIIIILSGIIALASVILIASRAALAGVIIGTIIVLFFTNKKVFVYLTSVTIILVSIHFIFNPFGSTVDIVLRMEEGLSQHDQFWKMAIDMFEDNPILGIGPGNYPKEEFNYIPVMLNSFAGETMINIHNLTGKNGSNNSHNFYLFMASDLGILGLMFAIGLLTIFFKTAFYTYKKYKGADKEAHLIIVGIISIGICLTLRGIVESNSIFYYGNISSDLPFWLMFITLLSFYRNRFGILSEAVQNEVK